MKQGDTHAHGSTHTHTGTHTHTHTGTHTNTGTHTHGDTLRLSILLDDDGAPVELVCWGGLITSQLAITAHFEMTSSDTYQFR